MMGGPKMFHKRTAVGARRVTEPKEGRGLAVDDDEAFETAAHGCERGDARHIALDRTVPAGNEDAMAADDALQSGSWRFTNFGGLWQRVHVGVGGEHGARERMP